MESIASSYYADFFTLSGQANVLQITFDSYNSALNAIYCGYRTSAIQSLHPSPRVLSQNTYRIIDLLLSYPTSFRLVHCASFALRTNACERLIPSNHLTAHRSIIRRLNMKAREFSLIRFAAILATTMLWKIKQLDLSGLRLNHAMRSASATKLVRMCACMLMMVVTAFIDIEYLAHRGYWPATALRLYPGIFSLFILPL